MKSYVQGYLDGLGRAFSSVRLSADLGYDAINASDAVERIIKELRCRMMTKFKAGTSYESIDEALAIAAEISSREER